MIKGPYEGSKKACAIFRHYQKVTMFKPHDSLSKHQIRSGLKWLYMEAIASLGFNCIISSGILTAFALLLGANAFQVGFLGATPFIFQPLQLLFVPFTELCVYGSWYLSWHGL